MIPKEQFNLQYRNQPPPEVNSKIYIFLNYQALPVNLLYLWLLDPSYLTDIQNPGFPSAVYRNHTLPSGVVDIFSVFSKPKLENRRTDTSLSHVSAELLPVSACFKIFHRWSAFVFLSFWLCGRTSHAFMIFKLELPAFKNILE